MFAVFFPWIVAVCFSTGTGPFPSPPLHLLLRLPYPASPLCYVAGSLLNQLINWSSALKFVELNFLMPLLLYVFMFAVLGMQRKLNASLDVSAALQPVTFIPGVVIPVHMVCVRGASISGRVHDQCWPHTSG